MVWRKWIVRGIVWGIIGACGAGALAYQRWTNSAAVRDLILAKMREVFPGADVSVDSAQLRILGGVQINGLRLARKDDPEKHEFLQVPSAIFYHDKEKILDGELTLRKIELIRPRMVVRRRRDGKWNLQDLVRPSGDKAQTPLPAIVIHQGTLILVDQIDPARTAVLEINDVGMTIINDPLPKVTIRGAAASELLGRLQLHGTLDRGSNEAFLSFKATQVALTQSLLKQLPLPGPANLLDGLKLSATANLEGRLWYHPAQKQPLFYDVRCEVSNGKVEHPKLPLPLAKLHAMLHCNDGALELETLTACSGPTEVEVHGKAQLPRIDQEFEVHVDLKHVMLGESLAVRLPDKIRALHQMFQPNGPTSIHLACAQHEGQWVTLTSGKPSLVSLRPENIFLKFNDFPYPLERTTGSVDFNLLDERVDIDLTTHAGDRPVILRGHWTGEKDNADVDFNILADDIPIDDTLLNALKTDGLRVLYNFSNSFHATGKVNIVAKIKHEPGRKFTNIFKLHFHEASICWDDFPYPLTNVSGTLEIYPTYWAIRQFQGWHKAGHIIVNGQSTPDLRDEKGKSHGIKLEITGRNVPLQEELHEALRPMKGLYDAWSTFRPEGNLSFMAVVDRPSSDPRRLDVKVNAQRACVKPVFFPYLIEDIGGDFWFKDDRLMIRNLRAKHKQTSIQVNNGDVELNSRGAGGYYANFADLQVVGFQLDDDFIQAIPSEKLRKAAQTLQLNYVPSSPPVRFLTRLVIKQPPETGKPPEVYWDGRLWVENARFSTGLEFSNVTGEIGCRGLTNGGQIVAIQGNALIEQALLYNQPFGKYKRKDGAYSPPVHASFMMREKSPDLLEVDLHAPIFDGDVTGQVKVQFNSTLSYRVNVTASKINVAKFGQHNIGPQSQLTGEAKGRLVLSGWGTGAETIEGDGEVEAKGHIYNLPFLLEFLKSLGLNRTDRTTFEEFHTAFNVQSTKVHLQKVDLLGNTLSLAGRGGFDLTTKDLKLDVYPMWGRVEQLFPREIRQLPAVVSKNLLMVEVRGKVSSDTKALKYYAKPLPIVLGPVQSIWELLNSKGAGANNSVEEMRNPDPTLDGPGRTRLEKN